MTKIGSPSTIRFFFTSQYSAKRPYSLVLAVLKASLVNPRTFWPSIPISFPSIVEIRISYYALQCALLVLKPTVHCQSWQPAAILPSSDPRNVEWDILIVTGPAERWFRLPAVRNVAEQSRQDAVLVHMRSAKRQVISRQFWVCSLRLCSS